MGSHGERITLPPREDGELEARQGDLARLLRLCGQAAKANAAAVVDRGVDCGELALGANEVVQPHLIEAITV